MKTKGRFLALAMAAACIGGAAVPMGVSAAPVYNARYDINVDGAVSILDVMALNRYLNGQYYVSNPAVMDVDNNLVITQGDSQCVMAYVILDTYTITFN